jgi:copper chaperone NosL
MNSRLKPFSRIISVLCALGLIAALFVPLWRIELSAPQYPEGLVLQIHPGKLGGDVEVVNGLNHYIGMRTLHDKDFVEFTILPWIIGALAFFGLLSALINRKWFFMAWVAFFMAFGIVAMADFYRWEYNYGHNLDESAPIKVPGMAYQPPLIGYKKLLNFGAYSIPDIGGWIFIAVALLLIAGFFVEIRKSVRLTKGFELRTASVIFTALIAGLSSCNQGPDPIQFGTDGCDFCKMTISDSRFGGELITLKGKIYKFDDMHCLESFLNSGQVPATDMKAIYLIDFSIPGTLIPAEGGFYLKSPSLRSPMGGNIAAFRHEDSLNKFKKLFPGESLHWNEVLTQ